MLHSIFSTVDMAHDYPVAEGMTEEDLMGEEMVDDNAVDAESLNGDIGDNVDSKNKLPLTKKFYCEDCGKLFTTNKTLRRHIRRIHNKTPDPIPTRSPPVAKIADGSAVCCRDCGIWFSAKKNLLRHIRTSTTHKQQAKKKILNELVEDELPMPDTDNEHNIPEQSATDFVTEDMKDERLLNEEIDIVEVKMELSSDQTLGKANNIDENCIEDIKMDQIDENMDVDSNSADYVLRKDDTVFTVGTDRGEGNSRRSVDGVSLKKYPCEECGQQFTKKSNVYRHMRRIHRMNIAVQKGKETSSPAASEPKILVFACEKCDQKFTKQCDLERHVQSFHSKSDIAVSNSGSVKDITCEHCLQNFASRSNLLRHIRRQHLAKAGLPSTTSRTKLKSSSSASSVAVQPFLVLDKNLRLGDYPFLKNMLPASYDYNLRCYSILTAGDNPAMKYKCFDATLQFPCTTVGESKYWVSLFEKTNRLSFDCKSSHSQENDANCSQLQYKCSVKGCPSLLIISTIGANVQRRNVVRVTVRIVHKHNHQWTPPRLDLSQLVEAVIEEQDLVDSDSEQISIAPDPGFYVPPTTSTPESQPSVMTLYFDKSNNSYVTQNMSLIANGASNDAALPGLVIVANRSKKDGENGSGASGEFDAVGQFKRVCADMAVMIQQDPQYFAEAVQQFETSFDRVCSSKYDLLNALCKFGNTDEISETLEP